MTAIEDTPEPEPAPGAVEDDPAPEPEPTPDPEPEPPEIDITVIPEVITEAYVEAVLAELEQLYFEAYLALREAGEPTAEVTDLLASAFTDPQYEARLREFIDIAESGFEGFRATADASPRVHRMTSVRDVGRGCLYAETLMDVSGLLTDTGPPQVTFVELGPRDVQRFVDLNPTRWIIHSLPIDEADKLRGVTPCSG